MHAYRGAALLAGVTIGALALALLSPVSSVASTPDPLAVTSRAAVDPIVGAWKWVSGSGPQLIVHVTGSGGNYVGHVVQDTSGNRCPYPVGKLVWTIRGSGENYTGTVEWLDVYQAPCRVNSSPAIFRVDARTDGLAMCVQPNGFCADFARTKPVATAPDTTAPKVTIKVGTGIIGIAEKFNVSWSVTDDSKKAKVTLTLYSGGRVVFSDPTSDGLIKATGQVHESTFRAGYVDTLGPFYMCVSAVDGAGIRSAEPPKCEWLSIQVPVPKVSNGCGGAQFGPGAEAVQNWMLDTQKYGGETVNFRAACNQHDAAYGGATVYDPFLKRKVDFRTWSRAKIDEKFAEDLQTLCHKYLDHRNVHPKEMSNCTHGPTLADVPQSVAAGISPGATAYFEGVRKYAQAAFDTNVVIAGNQTDNNMPSTWPPGGLRDNT